MSKILPNFVQFFNQLHSTRIFFIRRFIILQKIVPLSRAFNQNLTNILEIHDTILKKIHFFLNRSFHQKL